MLKRFPRALSVPPRQPSSRRETKPLQKTKDISASQCALPLVVFELEITEVVGFLFCIRSLFTQQEFAKVLFSSTNIYRVPALFSAPCSVWELEGDQSFRGDGGWRGREHRPWSPPDLALSPGSGPRCLGDLGQGTSVLRAGSASERGTRQAHSSCVVMRVRGGNASFVLTVTEMLSVVVVESGVMGRRGLCSRGSRGLGRREAGAGWGEQA